MKLPRWQSWSITARLIMLAVVPAFLVFVIVSFALYFTGQEEIRQDIEERGRLLAAAIAESSQYGVVSGNASYLESTLRRLLAGNPSIASIGILDAQREPVVVVAQKQTHAQGAQVFEVPIQPQVPNVDLFDKMAAPHVSLGAERRSDFRDLGPPDGYVRVTMSPAPLIEAKRERYLIAVAMVFLATLFSGLAGLYLAHKLRRPLQAVMGALRQIRQGQYQVDLSTDANGELGELQRAIVQMARGLSITRQELEDQVATRTSELQKAIDGATKADAERRRLIARGNALLEDERRRIAAELHDHLAAALIFLRMEAQRIANLASRTAEASSDAHEIQSVAQQLAQTTSDLYESARNLVKQLRPEVIDTLGLTGAIEEMVHNYDGLKSDCRFSFEVCAGFPDLRGELAITAYRVVQEALSNVLKHADATLARVTLEPTQPGNVRITIADNGKGFDTGTSMSTGIGLIGMRERVFNAGGSMNLTSDPLSGTQIAIELPAKELRAET